MRKDLPSRKPNRLKGHGYSSAGYYFITICVKDGHEVLGNIDVGAAICRPPIKLSDIGLIAEKSINNISKIYPHILIDKYVIMPNHVHMILHVTAIGGGRQVAAPTVVQTVVGNMKRYVSMQIGFSPWQKSFHDHIIRNETEYRKIWQYIDQNPQRWADDCYYTK